MTLGASPSAIGVETAGRLGTGAAGIEQHDVTPETINEIQRQVSETFDQFLKKFFPELQDWYFSLETAHEKETLDEWTVKKLQFDTAKIAVDAGFDVKVGEDGKPVISGEGKQPMKAPAFGGGNGGGGKSDSGGTGGDASGTSSASKMLKKSASIEDLEKASKWQTTIKQGSKDYKMQLDAFSTRIFDALRGDIDSVLTVSLLEDNHVTPDLKMALIGRTTKILDHYLLEGERLATDAAAHLYRLGRHDADTDTNLVQKVTSVVTLRKQDELPDTAAIAASQKRTIEAMRNTLYFGDKDSYLQTINDTIDQCIMDNCTTDQLAKALQEKLDPQREHFSDYMWERIARTESASYVTQGRIDAYTDFGIPLLKRIVVLDSRTDPVRCAPFDGAIYRIEDADGVIPAHVNCRCAFSPYFGDEPPIDSADIIYND